MMRALATMTRDGVPRSGHLFAFSRFPSNLHDRSRREHNFETRDAIRFVGGAFAGITPPACVRHLGT
jgi:hypothetical protein